MASRATKASEQRTPLRDQIAEGALACKPGRKVGFAHDDDRADHSGMSAPAELSEEDTLSRERTSRSPARADPALR
jgi:hypothetical protein